MPTLFSKGSGFLKPTYSVPTHETMPSPLGRCPAGGVSVSSLSFSTACTAHDQVHIALHNKNVLLLLQPRLPNTRRCCWTMSAPQFPARPV